MGAASALGRDASILSPLSQASERTTNEHTDRPRAECCFPSRSSRHRKSVRRGRCSSQAVVSSAWTWTPVSLRTGSAGHVRESSFSDVRKSSLCVPRRVTAPRPPAAPPRMRPKSTGADRIGRSLRDREDIAIGHVARLVARMNTRAVPGSVTALCQYPPGAGRCKQGRRCTARASAWRVAGRPSPVP
jgi:hypothetical protein